MTTKNYCNKCGYSQEFHKVGRIYKDKTTSRNLEIYIVQCPKCCFIAEFNVELK